MLFLFIITFLRGCILSEGDSVYTNGFSDRIQWVYIEDYKNFDFSYCDFIIVSNPPAYSFSGIDSLLLQYTREGGNLYFESLDFTGYATLERYVQYIVTDAYTKDTLRASGSGIFEGVSFRLMHPPLMFFTVDTSKEWDFVKVEDNQLIEGAIVLYATSIGKGSVIFSSYLFMQDSVQDELRKRLEGYFFPDISVISDSVDSTFRYMAGELYRKEGLFLRFYWSDFEGVPAGRVAVVNVYQNIIGPDTMTIFYMGPFVCEMLSFCDTVPPYVNFYLQGKGFELLHYETLAVGDGNREEIVFVAPSGKTIGFLSGTERVGFLPFSLSSISPDDRVRFLACLADFKYGSSSIKERLEYFKGALAGTFRDVQDVMVFTIDGRVVYHLEGSNSIAYNFNSLPDGLYIIKLKLNSGKDSLMLLNKLQGDKQ